jgi:hypothetical protein
LTHATLDPMDNRDTRAPLPSDTTRVEFIKQPE